MVGRLIKLLLDTFIHGYALHSVYGWSVYLVGAIWDSLTQLLLHLGRDRPKKTNNVSEPDAPKDEETDNVEILAFVERGAKSEHIYPPLLTAEATTYTLELKNYGNNNATHNILPFLIITYINLEIACYDMQVYLLKSHATSC
ncbi:hypothetical protein ALC60_05684 [Trachymyrmex zeteki]|uniref:Uncharacterized protein n=1 Tax=Mycetomoellerius zeteki TaxID=64791 RepID=A0A151X4P9_9HYME|nr:hypothetical protein ALC60_05684 [Trachymyrmex zeteki]